MGEIPSERKKSIIFNFQVIRVAQKYIYKNEKNETINPMFFLNGGELVSCRTLLTMGERWAELTSFSMAVMFHQNHVGATELIKWDCCQEKMKNEEENSPNSGG